MKMFLATVLVAAGLASAQSLPLTELCQIESHSAEMYQNGGGRSNSRIGNGGGNYHALLKIDPTGYDISASCTLFVSQRSTATSGGADYDSGGFNTTVSTVQGAWVSGSANSDPEEGSVCFAQRAYSATTPTYWVDGVSTSTFNSVSNGQAGSHVNSTGVVWHTETSGLMSYVVLDVALLQDLKNGFGGLRISRAVGVSAEASIYFLGAELRWNSSLPPVTASVPAVARIRSITIAPNPARDQVRFFFEGIQSPEVGIFDLQGRNVARVEGQAGTALWNGLNASGAPVPSGVYLYRLVDGNNSAARTLRWIR